MRIILLLFTVIISCNKLSTAEINDVKCDAQLEYFNEALSKRERWSIDLLDSWSKFQSGVSSGNFVDLGHFDQCTRFVHNSKDSNIDVIKGQHCMIYYRATANASTHENDGIFDWREIGSALRERNLRLGGAVCMPASCSTTKIRQFVNETVLASADLVITNDYDQSMFCSTNEPIPFETIDIVAIIIASIFVLLLISSTTYEIYMIHKNQTPCELYSAFSIYKNGKKLFDTKRGHSKSIIHCLPGLRTFSMFQIMLGHRYGWTRGFPNINTNDYTANGIWQKTIWSAIVNIHPIAVDTFFVLGGCLLARSIFNSIEKGKFNIPKMYLHRYMRVMPVLAFLILIVVSIYKMFGDGPFYEFTTRGAQIDHCKQYYWAALLHIQNYYNPLEGCIQPSWYLSADFHLVLISPLVMYPAYKYGWKFMWIFPCYIIGIVAWIFTASMIHEYKPARLLMPSDAGLQSAIDFYFPTHIRCGPWLMGVMLGYTFFKLNGRKIIVPKHLNILFWILTLTTLIGVLIGMWPLQNYENSPPQVVHALFFSLQRNSWGLAITWIIFACEMGYGGIVGKFLELPIWRPLGRMSLSFYLVHTLYITVHVGRGRVPHFFDDATLLHIYAGDIIVSTILASILYLTFEEPFLIVENYIYKRIEQRSVKTKSNKEEA
ncbi:unnamed protein product [Chironomus riparius]|uniref:Nose resistant-to-fluoxetine protein N-terminal domain-containing protein n=1 Tax=Chironomus riparius TaxID=315576 RepID=A0A9N9RQ65_9DIPT|nr:unnamed protein product [Chironomus riparius]